jgi:hypothetical protein
MIDAPARSSAGILQPPGQDDYPNRDSLDAVRNLAFQFQVSEHRIFVAIIPPERDVEA